MVPTYIIGKITYIDNNYLILENNGQGIIIYTPDIKRFKKDETRKLFISTMNSEYESTIYGFESFKELILFEDLISTNGIGPKKAMKFLDIGWKKLVNLFVDKAQDELWSITYIPTLTLTTIYNSYCNKYYAWIKNNFNDEIANKYGYWNE